MGFFFCSCARIAAVATVAAFARLRMSTLAVQGQNLFIQLLVAGRAIVPGRCCSPGLLLVPASRTASGRCDVGRRGGVLVTTCAAERADEPDDRCNLRVAERPDPKWHRLPPPLDNLGEFLVSHSALPRGIPEVRLV